MEFYLLGPNFYQMNASSESAQHIANIHHQGTTRFQDNRALMSQESDGFKRSPSGNAWGVGKTVNRTVARSKSDGGTFEEWSPWPKDRFHASLTKMDLVTSPCEWP